MQISVISFEVQSLFIPVEQTAALQCAWVSKTPASPGAWGWSTHSAPLWWWGGDTASPTILSSSSPASCSWTSTLSTSRRTCLVEHLLSRTVRECLVFAVSGCYEVVENLDININMIPLASWRIWIFSKFLRNFKVNFLLIPCWQPVRDAFRRV